MDHTEQLERLRRFLPPQLAEKVLAAGGYSLLDTHRREIAVLMADLRGFTAFTETAEPEEVVTVLRDFHSAVGTLVERYEASVGDFAGDGVMVYFNDPLPIPDPTAQAVRMATALRELFASLKHRWQGLGHDLDIGLGIAVGYATLGVLGPEPRFEYKPTGTVVNLTARLCAAAARGEILISHRARTLAGELLDVELAGEFTLKGIQRPVSAYRVTAFREAPPPVPVNRRTGVGLIGREPQLAHLQSALSRATRSEGQVVLLAGEPGIGKTRLAEELSRQAAAVGALTVWGRCSDREGAPAFWPWMQLVDRLAEEVAQDTVRTALGSASGILAQMVPTLKELVPDLEPPAPLDPDAARFRLYGAVTEFLSRLAKAQPIVVILDDIHWADVASLHLLAYLADHIGQEQIVVVATYRDVDPVVGPVLSETLAELSRMAITSRMLLSGLKRDDVARFILAVSGSEPTQSAVAEVHDRTEGNPFFVGELVRLLAAEGGSADADEAVQSPVPMGVRDVIRRRVARLPAETIELLHVASVGGRDVDLDVLVDVGGLDRESTLDALGPALEARLLAEIPGSMGCFRFSHALVNETLYEEIPAVRRSRLHRRVGDVIEERHGVADDDELTRLAQHFLLAVPSGGPDKALSYALRVAEWAEGRLAYEQAEDQLRTALELVTRLPVAERKGRELPVQMRLILLLTRTRGYGTPEVTTALARARELAIDVGDTAALAVCLWALCAFHTTRGEFETSRRFAEEARAVGERLNDPVLVMAGSWALGMIAFCRGQLRLAKETYERAIEIADALQDPSLPDRFGQDPSTNSRVFLGLVRWLLGDAEEAERLLAEAVSLAESSGRNLSLANALLFDAMLAVFMDDPTRARRSADKTAELCISQGFGLFQRAATVLHGWALARQGDPIAGGAQIEAGANQLLEAGTPMLHHFHLGLRADAFRLEGEPEKAFAALDQAFELVDEAGGLFWEAELHRLRGVLLLESLPARPAEAGECFRHAIAVARTQGASELEALAVTQLRNTSPLAPIG